MYIYNRVPDHTRGSKRPFHTNPLAKQYLSRFTLFSSGFYVVDGKEKKSFWFIAVVVVVVVTIYVFLSVKPFFLTRVL